MAQHPREFHTSSRAAFPLTPGPSPRFTLLASNHHSSRGEGSDETAHRGRVEERFLCSPLPADDDRKHLDGEAGRGAGGEGQSAITRLVDFANSLDDPAGDGWIRHNFSRFSTRTTPIPLRQQLLGNAVKDHGCGRHLSPGLFTEPVASMAQHPREFHTSSRAAFPLTPGPSPRFTLLASNHHSSRGEGSDETAHRGRVEVRFLCSPLPADDDRNHLDGEAGRGAGGEGQSAITRLADFANSLDDPVRGWLDPPQLLPVLDADHADSSPPAAPRKCRERPRLRSASLPRSFHRTSGLDGSASARVSHIIASRVAPHPRPLSPLYPSRFESSLFAGRGERRDSPPWKSRGAVSLLASPTKAGSFATHRMGFDAVSGAGGPARHYPKSLRKTTFATNPSWAFGPMLLPRSSCSSVPHGPMV